MKENMKKFGMEESNYGQNPMVPGFKYKKDEGGMKVSSLVYKTWSDVFSYPH